MFGSIRLLRQSLSSRGCISDEVFVGSVGVAPQHFAIVVLLRRCIAYQCQIASDSVYPDDSPKELSRLCGTGWDNLLVKMELEDFLDCDLVDLDGFPPFAGRWIPFGRISAPKSVAEWIRAVIAFLIENEHVSPSTAS
jgi:hypothetical protein